MRRHVLPRSGIGRTTNTSEGYEVRITEAFPVWRCCDLVRPCTPLGSAGRTSRCRRPLPLATTDPSRLRPMRCDGSGPARTLGGVGRSSSTPMARAPLLHGRLRRPADDPLGREGGQVEAVGGSDGTRNERHPEQLHTKAVWTAARRRSTMQTPGAWSVGGGALDGAPPPVARRVVIVGGCSDAGWFCVGHGWSDPLLRRPGWARDGLTCVLRRGDRPPNDEGSGPKAAPRPAS